ncbi:MAG: hypothetical protein HZA90_26365 [Verrucomicrobia bacterium]|nr:hypothetical protein [Verrucomicrobiota bacterium]
MNQLYPIIRRVRRPLVPVEEPRSSRREEAPSEKSPGGTPAAESNQSLVTSAATPADKTPVGPPVQPPPAPAAPVGERLASTAEAYPELLPNAGLDPKPKRRDTREKAPSK